MSFKRQTELFIGWTTTGALIYFLLDWLFPVIGRAMLGLVVPAFVLPFRFMLSYSFEEENRFRRGKQVSFIVTFLFSALLMITIVLGAMFITCELTLYPRSAKELWQVYQRNATEFYETAKIVGIMYFMGSLLLFTGTNSELRPSGRAKLIQWKKRFDRFDSVTLFVSYIVITILLAYFTYLTLRQ